MSATPIDLSRLPSPDIVETLSFESLLAERKQRLIALFRPEQQAGVAAALELESEPMLMLLQENAYRELVLRQRVNDAARSVMLAYAVRGDLDHLAALFGIERLTLVPADAAKNIAAVSESDADLRKRVQLAPQGYSVAGPEGAYISHALNADGRVLDASATSPAPCEVLVTILARDGDGTADDDLIAAVTTTLRDDDVRPLTDRVTVQSAEIVSYTVEATLTTFPGPDSAVVLAQARARLAAYVSDTHRLGRDVTVSGIYAALHIDGVQRVQLEAPAADIQVKRTQAAYCTASTLQHAGVHG
jgi:phage-related baseplate assembly protein